MHKLFLLSALFLFSACDQTPPPTPILPLPTSHQIEWQKLETYAFVHFGLNTFNDLEWGYGNTPASTFNPTELDCEQWVRIIKAAGLKGVMLTAKHHDGFCLWPSQYTDYSVKNSPWKQGRGDLVKELSDACRKYGLKFGIYLSPWDRNHADYGRPAYVEYFHNQMQELLSNYGEIFEYWFDGANGGDGWYGGHSEKRNIDARTYYKYEEARQTIQKLQPQAVIFGGTCPDIRWIGNEEGWAGETNWGLYDEAAQKYPAELIHGMPKAKRWTPGECDVSIRPGWFYHAREDHQVKTLAHLVDLYYRSVGRNANFLLNFPVGLNGKIHSLDSARALEWRQTLAAELNQNLLKHAKAEAQNTRGNSRKYAPSHTTDGDWDTYWATDDSIHHNTLTLFFPQKQTFNRLLLQEYIPLGQRIIAFQIDYFQQGQWYPLETTDSMTTIGYKRIIRCQTTEAEKIRIHFTRSRGPLCINNVEAYLAPPLLTEPVISRQADNTILIQSGDPETRIYYTTDHSLPTPSSTLYDPAHPFKLNSKGTIKAIAYSPQNGQQSPLSCRQFDIPRNHFHLLNSRQLAGNDKTLLQELTKRSQLMFDGDAYTAFYLPAKAKQEIHIDLGKKYRLNGFTYTPDQRRWGGCVITHYEFYVEDQLVAAGEFSNIVHNPIEQQISFPPTNGQRIRFVARTISGGQKAGIGEFTVLTEE